MNFIITVGDSLISTMSESLAQLAEEAVEEVSNATSPPASPPQDDAPIDFSKKKKMPVKYNHLTGEVTLKNA